MRTFGWTGRFREVPWGEILGRFRAMENQDTFRPMVDIVGSVVESGADRQLAGLTSMGELVVVVRPIPEPPMDEVIVRPKGGFVQIEHVTHTGGNDMIRRPNDEAVGLFWRFMIEKYGVHPSPTGAQPHIAPGSD